MTTRQVKKILHSTPTVEGAGVKLNRVFGFGKTSDFDPFLLLDDFRSPNPEDYLVGFPGTRIAGLKRSLICWTASLNMETAWATKASSNRAKCSG